jgi:integrase
MAKTVLHTVEGRQALKSRHSPYWVRLTVGCYLGLRKVAADSPGAWVCRYRDDVSGKQQVHSLGGFDNLPPSTRYDAAKKAAEAWFEHRRRGGSAEVVAVRTACERYVQHLRDEKRDKTANDVEARFERWVYGDDRLARLALGLLTRQRIEAWRKSLISTMVRVNYDDSNPVLRDRAPSSVNRDMTAMRAALNFAHDHAWVASDLGWRKALRPIKNADGRREVYLDRDQRRGLIEHAPADLALFLKGLSALPLRPGALAGLKAADFDKRLSTLRIGRDKAGTERRITLPPQTAAFIATSAAGKAPHSPLFTQADGRAWNKDAWKKPVKAAASEAKLPETTTAYALRHSTITDLMMSGLDPMTVAGLSGTSVLMIQKHYGHLRQEHAAAALATLAL